MNTAVLRLIGARLVTMVPVALGVAFLVFLLMHVAPGDPARVFLGDKATPESIAALRADWGLDRPLIIQFLDFLGGVFRGDLGSSITFGRPTTELVWNRLPATLLLMVMGTLFGVLLSAPLALWVARHPGGALDGTVRVVVAVIQGIPAFLIGTLLIMILGLQLRWFPVGGYGTNLGSQLYSMVLPALTVGLSMLPVLLRGFRASFITSLQGEPFAFGRAKGVATSRLYRDYVVRPAAVSGISLLGIQIGSLVGGVVIVENVFAIPGMGTLLMSGILNRDFPLVQGVTLVLAAMVIIVYLLVDVAYATVDPRVKFS